jgi:hypothetical protein
MSRVRIGLRPGEWRDEGAQAHVSRKPTGGTNAVGGIFVVGRSAAQKHAEQVAAYKAREKVT